MIQMSNTIRRAENGHSVRRQHQSMAPFLSSQDCEEQGLPRSHKVTGGDGTPAPCGSTSPLAFAKEQCGILLSATYRVKVERKKQKKQKEKRETQ